MEQYVNYYKKSLEEISNLPGGRKSRLLMHVCCGPCSCFPLTFLCPHFELTLHFNNSNIYPDTEYQRRLKELQGWLKSFENEYGYHVDLVVTPYEHESYMEDLRPLKDEREGGQRCLLCYEKRMAEAYDYAESHGFDYFCTVMSISRQKNSQRLNEIGQKLEALRPHTKYFYSDFKKADGALKGDRIAEAHNLYRQDYCGCEYSLAQRDLRKASKNEK